MPVIHLGSTDERILASALGATLATHPATAGLPAHDHDDVLRELMLATYAAFATDTEGGAS